MSYHQEIKLENIGLCLYISLLMLIINTQFLPFHWTIILEPDLLLLRNGLNFLRNNFFAFFHEKVFKVLKKTTFINWMQCRQGRKEADFFLSYRQKNKLPNFKNILIRGRRGLVVFIIAHVAKGRRFESQPFLFFQSPIAMPYVA